MQELEHWKIERFIEYARNPRKNDQGVDRLAAAIKEFGFRVPILAKSDGTADRLCAIRCIRSRKPKPPTPQ